MDDIRQGAPRGADESEEEFFERSTFDPLGPPPPGVVYEPPEDRRLPGGPEAEFAAYRARMLKA